MKTKETDPTLAMRMMLYNSQWHPESQISHDMYAKTISDAQTAFVQKILRGHTDAVFAVAFSPDGKKIVFCSNRNNGGTRDTNVFVADWAE